MSTTSKRPGLLPGEWVEVRSAAEILSTLDDDAALDGQTFMPEMLAYCGQRFQVYKRADKTCETISQSGMRRLTDTVHLQTLRCDGSAHGGCQAECLLFWKEAWLRRVEGPDGQASLPTDEPSSYGVYTPRDLAWLEATTQRGQSSAGEVLYRCQATEVKKASSPLPWWTLGQYVSDVRVNGVPLRRVIRSLALGALNKLTRRLAGRAFPNVAGTLKRTPSEVLDLQPGEWVIVKTKQEILATLDTGGRNRGMTFEPEMIPYCGKRYRVLRRVEQIIEESTGRMKKLGGVSIILEEVICASFYRRPCPRANYLFWREIWLHRASEHEQPPESCEAAAGCALAQAAGLMKTAP